MKKLIISLSLLVSAVSVVSASNVQVTEDGVKVYRINSNSSIEITTVNSFSALEKVAVKGDYTKISYNGITGWVETKYIQEMSASLGKEISMSGENINGENNLEIIDINGDQTSQSTALKVNRSFSNDLNAPLDKENLERSHTEYVKY